MIEIILVGAGFIIMPLVFIYFLAIKPIIKYARCSESVDGKITHIEKTVDYSSRGKDGSNVFYMVTCEYYYGGEKYVSEVKAYGTKFNASEGENISFFINPKNPLEAHMRHRIGSLKNVLVAAMMMLFVIAGIDVTGEMIAKEYGMGTDSGSQVVQDSGENGDESSAGQLDSGQTENNQGSVGQIDAGQADGNQGSVGQADGNQGSASQTEQNNTTAQAVNPETQILTNKNMKSDMNYYYIKNAKKVMVNEVILYVPKTYEVMYETDIEQELKDSTTGEKIVIKVIDTTKDIYAHQSEIRDSIIGQYNVAKFDSYSYNGNNFLVTYRTEGKTMLFAIAVNEKKNVYIEYESEGKDTLELRDVLSSIIF